MREGEITLPLSSPMAGCAAVRRHRRHHRHLRERPVGGRSAGRIRSAPAGVADHAVPPHEMHHHCDNDEDQAVRAVDHPDQPTRLIVGTLTYSA